MCILNPLADMLSFPNIKLVTFWKKISPLLFLPNFFSDTAHKTAFLEQNISDTKSRDTQCVCLWFTFFFFYTQTCGFR